MGTTEHQHQGNGVAEKLLYRIPEAAGLLDLGLTKTYELVRSGRLRAVHIDRAIRIPADSLREFVERLVASQDDQ